MFIRSRCDCIVFYHIIFIKYYVHKIFNLPIKSLLTLKTIRLDVLRNSELSLVMNFTFRGFCSFDFSAEEHGVLNSFCSFEYGIEFILFSSGTLFSPRVLEFGIASVSVVEISFLIDLSDSLDILKTRERCFRWPESVSSRLS